MPVSQRVIAAYLSQRGALGGGGAAPAAPANTVAPVASGTATVGSTLSVTTGTWTGDATIVYTYQWQRAGVNIGSATANTYVLVTADAGTAVRCVVTGTNGVGNASANSNAISVAALTYDQQVAADSPNAWWKLNDASGNPVDSSGNGLTQTVNGSPTYHAPGPGATAAPFAMTFPVYGSSYLQRNGASAFLALGDVFTVECWVKRNAAQGATQILVQKVGAYYILFTSSDNLQLQRQGLSNICTSTTTLTDTASWHHLVATKNGAAVHLYIDAVDVTGAVTNDTFTDTITDLTFAGSGSMAQVALYPTALSAARVSAHYAAMV